MRFPPLPTQYNAKNQAKLQVLVFNIVWGNGSEDRQVKLYAHVACAQKRLKVQICPKTFVHDCSSRKQSVMSKIRHKIIRRTLNVVYKLSNNIR